MTSEIIENNSESNQVTEQSGIMPLLQKGIITQHHLHILQKINDKLNGFNL